MQHAVAYYRVSTARQGRSGLGIEAQRAIVAQFVEQEDFELIAEFVETETGKGADALDRRPQLAAALAAGKAPSAQSLSPSWIDSPATSPSSPAWWLSACHSSSPNSVPMPIPSCSISTRHWPRRNVD